MFLFASGCGDAPKPVSSDKPAAGYPVVVAAANGEVAIAQRPERVVSLSPTATEILFAIGAGPQVVAADSASNYPPAAPRTELSGFDPNIEALADFRPDLVVFAVEPGNLGASLAAIGVPGLLQPAAARLDETYEQILDLGSATGNQPAAEQLVDRMRAGISRAVESLPRLSPAPTYYHELDEKYFTVTSGTFLGEIYGLFGLQNIADPADRLGNGYPQLSAEYIISANPDLIFLGDVRCCGQSAEALGARPGWDRIDAVRNGSVVELDDDVASRWGPRVVDLVDSVAGALKSYETAAR